MPPPVDPPAPPVGAAGEAGAGLVGPALMPDADWPPQARSPSARSANWLRLAISRASVRLPYSQPVENRPVPATRINPSLTRSCAHVNDTAGPSGITINAERSENDSRDRNGPAAEATRRALPGSSVF